MTGSVNIIGCGGCGISVAIDVYESLNELSKTEGFAIPSITLLDTTDKTIQANPEYSDKFTKIQTDRLSIDTLDGTGGERRDPSLIKDINKGINTFVDNGVDTSKNNYYFIISSASGGSGSIISPLLLKAMRKQDATVILITIGDNSNLLFINNTINTLSSLYSISVATKTAQPIIYYNNTVNGVTSPNTERSVNDKIKKLLSIISVYIGGNIKDIDHQDMNNFFIPSRYSSFTVNPGLYNVGVGEVELSDKKAIIARTIVNKGEDIKINVPLLHNKVGTIPEELSEVFSNYPVYLILRKDIMSEEIKFLKEEYKRIEEIKNTSTDGFDPVDDAMLDEFGLAL